MIKTDVCKITALKKVKISLQKLKSSYLSTQVKSILVLCRSLKLVVFFLCIYVQKEEV